jgi:hypothetical protein
MDELVSSSFLSGDGRTDVSYCSTSLLMREMSVNNIIRMWDTYLVKRTYLNEFAISADKQHNFTCTQAEGTDAFSEFHLYVCLAFLVKWSDQLLSMDFQVT